MNKQSRIVSETNTWGRVLLIAAALTLGGNLANAGTEKNTMNDTEALKRAERTWVESLETGDARRLATIIDEKFTFIGPDGELERREAYLAGYAAMPKMGVVVERLDVDDVEVRVLGDVGIVTGHVVAHIKMQGAAMQENVRFTRVYRRSPHGWLMTAGQGTRITPAPAQRPPGKG
jgi:ketosteroid isomerase-like protein